MARETQTCAIGILANRPNAQESDSPRTEPMEKSTKNLTVLCKTNPIFSRTKPMQPSLPQRIMKIIRPGGLEKTNPIKANFKRDDGFSAYYTRDFHGATAAHLFRVLQ